MAPEVAAFEDDVGDHVVGVDNESVHVSDDMVVGADDRAGSADLRRASRDPVVRGGHRISTWAAGVEPHPESQSAGAVIPPDQDAAGADVPSRLGLRPVAKLDELGLFDARRVLDLLGGPREDDVVGSRRHRVDGDQAGLFVMVAVLHDEMGEVSAHGVDDHVGDLADGTVSGFDGHALGEPDCDAGEGTRSVPNGGGLLSHDSGSLWLVLEPIVDLSCWRFAEGT